MSRRNGSMTVGLALFLAWAVPSGAADFPPITDEERAFDAVPWQPGAPAVILFERADVKLRDYGREPSSSLTVRVRLKILSEAGKELGEVEIPHSRAFRLRGFHGRTVTPDGREVPVGEDAIFVEERSRSRKRYVTKAAFPAVEVGAILDYEYTTVWDSFYYLEPWLFHGRIPKRISEITYHKPGNLAVQPWAVKTGRSDLRFEEVPSRDGGTFRVSVEELSGIPDEPFSFPFVDLSTRFMLVPTTLLISGRTVPLLESWRAVAKSFVDDIYAPVSNDDGAAKKRAREVAGELATSRAKVAALYALVRDDVRTEPDGWIGVRDKASVDRALQEARGTPVEKALLLQAMLAAVGVDADLVWATDRGSGKVDLAVANPWWFDRLLLTVELDGERLFLDPADRRLGLGRLAPDNDGTEALLVDRKKPLLVHLPQLPFEDNARRAKVELSLDAAGRLSGSGTLVLTGHHAYRRLRWAAAGEDAAEPWREWLATTFEGYEVSGVTVEESLDEETVHVAWSMAQRDEAVLGDEASLRPSSPLGPVQQVFTLPAARRRTPVQLPFADRDEVELTVGWPAGWEVEVAPEPVAFSNDAGELAVAVASDPAARRLTYTRRLDTTRRELHGHDGYEAIRALIGAAESHDSEELVLVRR